MPFDFVGVFPLFLFFSGGGGGGGLEYSLRATPRWTSFRSIFQIGRLQDDIMLLPRPEFFRMLFSCAN